MKKEVRFNVKGFIDRRGPRELEAFRALEQARADRALEDEWRRRVAANVKEISRVTHCPPVPALLRHQAN